MLTREISIGNLLIGGTQHVVVQSMTNTDTMDTVATVQQVLALVDAGCEMVRITARNIPEAENLRNIKQTLAGKNCFIPLIADIHFQPLAAETAARIVEKVRINPGNYIDKKAIGQQAVLYTEETYQRELETISHRLKPLLDICKEYGTAIRVGVNHGSLSDRVTGRYGDTVEGMVASAIEYVDICRYHGFHNLVLSMKSSDVKTMIYAYRMLAARMEELGYDYPLHLGVTEAGAGMDARIKSAAGIGELLNEGIGDTIRVSLTENPINEIPVAKMLVKNFSSKNKTIDFIKQFECKRYETHDVPGIGGDNAPVCVYPGKELLRPAENLPDFFLDLKDQTLKKLNNNGVVKVIRLDLESTKDTLTQNDIMHEKSEIFLWDITSVKELSAGRNKLVVFQQSGNKIPVILYKKYQGNEEEVVINASAEFACFLADRLVQGICIDLDGDTSFLPGLMFGILQAMGLRRIKAEFIACPTCGRTSYDVEGTLNRLTTELSHLKRLKIGVMGCIVNGPGEMADADYGYVGASSGKINLYRKKQAVLKNIDESKALDELIKLIKEDGNWIEPATVDIHE